MNDPQTKAIILAGGQGNRLAPLTNSYPKPYLPIGGKYRLIDFTMMNLLGAGVKDISVITQYLPQFITNHLAKYYQRLSDIELQFLSIFQNKTGVVLFSGTADAIWKNFNFLDIDNCQDVIILPSDHLYEMDIAEALAFHKSSASDFTILSTLVSKEEAPFYGNIICDDQRCIIEFVEKPADPVCSIGDKACASMGIYIIKARVLKELYEHRTEAQRYFNDFGYDTLPEIINNYKVKTHFSNPATNPNFYWRDLANIEQYTRANFEFLKRLDSFETIETQVFGSKGDNAYFDSEANYLISQYSQVSSTNLNNTIIAPHSSVGKGASLHNTIVFPYAHVAAGEDIHNTIVTPQQRVDISAFLNPSTQEETQANKIPVLV